MLKQTSKSIFYFRCELTKHEQGWIGEIEI